MPNHLLQENSPYLLQHANNPVEWYPWGKEALARARTENKPIFLSIGYAACHWCHVMEHESFENPDTAELMNKSFVNIKVDREERPDLDSIYMQAVVAMTGQGGWPMSVFLTPDLKPFYAGTYFPPVRRYNMPSFREVLLSVTRVWESDQTQVQQSGTKITEHLLSTNNLVFQGGELNPKQLDQAAFSLAQAYDWKYGGWGNAPKFPQPMAIEFLLRKATRGDKFALEIAVHALRAIAKGGMYDVIGGGFARYSTDNEWKVPHFEKMLYDNAQLALVNLHAYLITRDSHFRRICEETLDFVIREMTHQDGGFYSSLDADSEGEEGKFYVWTKEQIQQALVATEDITFFNAAYGVTEKGNFEGQTVLQRAIDNAQLSERFEIPPDAVVSRLSGLHARLLKAREQRVRPGTDDKVLVAWNALTLATFAEAARYLNRSDYLTVATRNAQFLWSQLRSGNRLLRSWRNGQARHNAYLEDYAALALGFISLYQTDPQRCWIDSAKELVVELISRFQDPAGGFFDTSNDHENLLYRPKEIQDNATPSGNALATYALLQLAAYTGHGEYRDIAETNLASIQDLAARYPTAFAQWLIALDFASGPVFELVVIGDHTNAQTQSLVNVVWENFRPRMVYAGMYSALEENYLPLFQDRKMLEGLPTAYICQQFTCKQPVQTAALLRKQLEDINSQSN
jgi:hypothetical protein